MKIVFPLLFPLLLLCSCKKEEQAKEPIPVNLTSFPLATGNSWRYHTLQTTIFSTSTEYDILDTYWEVLTDTIISGTESYKMLQQQFIQNSDEIAFTSYFYYANSDSGFYKIAHGIIQNPTLYFKNEFTEKPWLCFIEIPTNITTGLVVLYPRPLLLKFPVDFNNDWTSHEYQSAIKRKWLGYETITTAAGTFDCVKMQVIADYNLDGLQDEEQEIVFQYFSTKGLIRQSISWHVFSNTGELGLVVRSTDLIEVNF